MSKVKLLLYCTKNGRPLVWGSANPYMDDCYTQTYGYSREEADKIFSMLNGKIVAECDCDNVYYYEMEYHHDDCYQSISIYDEIESETWDEECFTTIISNKYTDEEIANSPLLKDSCLSFDELGDYVCPKGGINTFYALHLTNLTIYYEPKELSEFYKDSLLKERILKAPKNMCKAYDKNENKYILVSIRPEWLCKILNGEKTIEVRKQILRELMELENEKICNSK